LDDMFLQQVQVKYELAPGDMPNAQELKVQLQELLEKKLDSSQKKGFIFPKAHRRLLKQLDQVVFEMIPAIMEGNIVGTGVTEE